MSVAKTEKKNLFRRMSIKERIASVTQEDVVNQGPSLNVNKLMEKELRHLMLLEQRLDEQNELAELDSQIGIGIISNFNAEMPKLSANLKMLVQLINESRLDNQLQ